MTIALTMERTECKVGHALLALLVLASWIATAFTPMPTVYPAGAGSDPIAAVLVAQTMCHTYDPNETGSDRHAPVQPLDRGHDCGMCPICNFIGAPLLAPGSGAVPAAPITFAENRQTKPPRSTGPPPAPWIGAIPRGPPARFV
jgi:hypothetical protein